MSSTTACCEPIIEIEGVTKRYPKAKQFALRGINLSINKGEFFGLLGPNGCGKTTLISILCGLLRTTQGKIHIAGKLMHKPSPQLRQLVGLVPQEVALYPTLTFKENLLFFGKLYGLSKKVLMDRLDKCLEVAGLKDCLYRQVGKYSGGMKRRANLALSLVHNPKILFLDEPTVNVDPQSREVIFNILTELNQSGTTMIYTTHYLEEAQHFCDRVAVVELGKVITTGTPQELIDRTPEANDLGEVFLQLTGRKLRD